MDGRNPWLRPRTTKTLEPSGAPEGWPGLDPLEQRNPNPMRTFETPLVWFPGDIAIPASTTASISLPQRCSQIAFLDVVPGVWANINGGGYRKIKDGFVYNGDFSSLEVQTDGAGSCTVQLASW